MMGTSPLEAFDTCSERATRNNLGTLESVCPRYPAGAEIHAGERVFSDASKRRNLAVKLGCAGCTISSGRRKSANVFEGFHPDIAEPCKPKFESGHYDDATLTGILVVRDRLRELTGYETAADAFGKGGLIIAGSANEHTDNNFQQGAKLLMMANDRFRNEFAHTNDQNDYIKQPGIALQFLGTSSIAMYMLDGARVSDS